MNQIEYNEKKISFELYRRKIKNSVNILKIKENNKYTDNKEWMIMPNAIHTDLYDGKDIFPFNKIESFYKE